MRVSDLPLPIDRTVETIRGRVAAWRREGLRVALVPTMGALHEGHLALVRRAREGADRVVVSVFVNPTQFAAGEDLATYPRDLEGDVAKLSQLADAVFAPEAEAMYPEGSVTSIHVEGPALDLEGGIRPHHFDGVATIVTKLLTVVAPEIAVFGEKDFQQLLVVRRLVADLLLPVEIVGAPIVRHEDGLALSSRNAYLDAEEREKAPLLRRAIAAAAEAIGAGEPAAPALDAARKTLRAAGFDIDYVALRNAETLSPVADGDAVPKRILAAARLGRTRLIDNVAV